MEPPGENDDDRMEWSGDLLGDTEAAAIAKAASSREDERPTSLLLSSPDTPRSGQQAVGFAESRNKPACGYGLGCSHTSAFHRARYAHSVSDSSGDDHEPGDAVGEARSKATGSGLLGLVGQERLEGVGAKFLCNECGLDFSSVSELQLHMVRKTAWSNQGLIGCRVSCLVDNREWHEGLVTQVRKGSVFFFFQCRACTINVLFLSSGQGTRDPVMIS